MFVHDASSHFRAGRVSSSLHRRAAVRVQGVVRRKLLGHILVIILGDGLKAAGERVESRRLWRELARIRVCASYDERERAERGIRELVLVEERVKRTALTVVS